MEQKEIYGYLIWYSMPASRAYPKNRLRTLKKKNPLVKLPENEIVTSVTMRNFLRKYIEKNLGGIWLKSGLYFVEDSIALFDFKESIEKFIDYSQVEVYPDPGLSKSLANSIQTLFDKKGLEINKSIRALKKVKHKPLWKVKKITEDIDKLKELQSFLDRKGIESNHLSQPIAESEHLLDEMIGS